MWEIYGHSGTGQLTDFRILGKENTYVVGTPLSTPTPCVCGGIIPCDRSMCCLSDDAATDDLHYEKLTLFCFLFWNVSPSPVYIHLYASSPIWPNMNPGVQTTTFVLSKFFFIPILQNMHTIIDITFWTQYGYLPAIFLSSAYIYRILLVLVFIVSFEICKFSWRFVLFLGVISSVSLSQWTSCCSMVIFCEVPVYYEWFTSVIYLVFGPITLLVFIVLFLSFKFVLFISAIFFPI